MTRIIGTVIGTYILGVIVAFALYALFDVEILDTGLYEFETIGELAWAILWRFLFLAGLIANTVFAYMHKG